MKQQNLRLPLLAGAVAVALGATAWANTDHSATATTELAPPTAAEERVGTTEPAPLATESKAVALNDSLSPNETVVTEESMGRKKVLVPVAETDLRTGITVEERRLSQDERIQATVMDLIANSPRLTGKIGVVSQDAVVTLTGYTMTAGQAWRAERAAGSVQGVKYVVNEIRPRIGGISS